MNIQKIIKSAFIVILIAAACPAPIFAFAERSWAFQAGMIPAMGGGMSSYEQSARIGVDNGIYGINRSEKGKSTKNIDQPVGFTGGGEFKLVLFNYYMARVGANYSRSIYGGTGKSLDPAGNIMKVEYSLWYYDIPLMAGISIPFWKDVRITLSGGLAYASGTYSNSFKSDAVNSKAAFSGWALPRVISLSGEYFINYDIAATTAISYYEGSTKVIKNRADYAVLDFTGYRFTFGVSYYMDADKSDRKKQQ